tara:strand:+ start:899 stop:1270 length:372 start_codon:yes stop_codon:yes gene_type:complete
MGIFSSAGSAIGSLFKGASSAVKTFGKNVIMKKADPTGGWLSTALSIGSSLMEKKAGGSGEWSPVDTSAGISVPSTGSYAVGFKKAGSAQSPDLRMKTVDGDTLNAEWEYRLKKGLRDKNLFS